MSLTDVKAINWNKLEDPLDKEIWERMTLNFWLDTRFPIANDIPSWNTLTDKEKLITARVFVGLTLLDTAQSRVGAPALMDDATTDHEASNLAFITGMEAIHAKSYSSIFSTLLSTEEINDAFRWSEENPLLQKKKKLVLEQYNSNDPLKKKITSVFLESFLFYSGFYLPFYWGSKAKLTNTRDIIRSILNDELVHGYYIGYKFQQLYKELPEDKQNEYKDFAYNLLQDLYDNEIKYTEELYDDIGLTEDVKMYIHYNANKALANLGFDPLFPDDLCEVNPVILASLSPEGESHDFFSGAGSSYVIGKVENTEDTDWDF